MDQLIEAALRLLLDQGLIGTILLLSLWVNWKFYTKIDALQERRIEDNRALINAVNESTANMEKLAEAVKYKNGG